MAGMSATTNSEEGEEISPPIQRDGLFVTIAVGIGRKRRNIYNTVTWSLVGKLRYQINKQVNFRSISDRWRFVWSVPRAHVLVMESC